MSHSERLTEPSQVDAFDHWLEAKQTRADPDDECGRFARRLKRLFRLGSPWAPGLFFVGGVVEPAAFGRQLAGHRAASLAGVGLSIDQAFRSCIGEGVEYLSQCETPQDIGARASLSGIGGRTSEQIRHWVEAHLENDPRGRELALDWVEGTRISDGRAVMLPADLCLRRLPQGPALSPRAPLSTGCAARPSFEAAVLHALLELIERDAASLWWKGGRRARPVSPETSAQTGTIELLAELRQGRDSRRSWLLDITTDLEIPCIAAVSVNLDGRGLACGLAARTTPREAVRAAILEMCQMELAILLVEAKLAEQGEGGLNDVDRRHLVRARAISAENCALLHPEGIPYQAGSASDAQSLDIGTIAPRLAGRGFDCYVVNLTRPAYGLAAVRAVAPALQLLPSDIISGRLRDVIRHTGGGAPHVNNVTLL